MIKKLSDLQTPMSPVYRCKRCGDVFTDSEYFVKGVMNSGVPREVAHTCHQHIYKDDESVDELIYDEIGIAELVGYDEV